MILISGKDEKEPFLKFGRETIAGTDGSITTYIVGTVAIKMHPGSI